MKTEYLKRFTAAMMLLTFTVAVSAPAFAKDGKGMTWGFRGYSFPGASANHPASSSKLHNRTLFVGCNAGGKMCNAYVGATQCALKRHVLCVKKSGNLKRPRYAVTTGANAMSKEAYSGWVPKRVKLSSKRVKGTLLTSRSAGDNFCGAGWKMASFHDGRWIPGMSTTNHYGASWNPASSRRGGWSYHVSYRGNPHKKNIKKQIKTLKSERFWVAIGDQKANCWN